MTARVVRLLILGGLAIAAAVFPATVGGPDRVDAQCLATFGSRNDGVCLDQPSAPAPGGPSSWGGFEPQVIVLHQGESLPFALSQLSDPPVILIVRYVHEDPGTATSDNSGSSSPSTSPC